MKQRTFALLLVLSLFSSCSLLVRYAGGIKSAKVESKESVQAYLNKLDNPFDYNYVMKGGADSATVVNNLFIAMQSNTILYDSAGRPLEYAGNASCGGIQIEQAFSAPDSFYQPSSTDSINLFQRVQNFERIDALQTGDHLPEADYYLVEYWGKYFEREKQKKGDYEWIASMQSESSHRIVVLLVNTDMQQDWGLNPKGKMKMKMKTSRKDGLWSIQMNAKSKRLDIVTED